MQTLAQTTLDADLCFKACSDRTRLRILSLLMQREELCVCELIDALALPQAKISRHLAYLRKTGLVSDRRDAQWVYYRLIRPSETSRNNKSTKQFHEALLASIAASQGVAPELKDDKRRLSQTAACGPGCC